MTLFSFFSFPIEECIESMLNTKTKTKKNSYAIQTVMDKRMVEHTEGISFSSRISRVEKCRMLMYDILPHIDVECYYKKNSFDLTFGDS